MQGQIIISCSVGTEFASEKVDYERENGKMEKLTISDYMQLLAKGTVARMRQPHMLFFPSMIGNIFTKQDKLYARNVDRLRATIQRIIEERRAGITKSSEMHADLLSILIESEMYQNNDNMMIDEIFTFFIAGMRTIQISTTNVFYYLNQNTQFKQKLLDEVVPVVASVKDNLLDGFTYEMATEFTYLQYVYNESLRIEPPASISGSQAFSEDTKISMGDQKVLFAKDEPFLMNFQAIHHDPYQWPEPEKFIPDRFDTSIEDNKWLKTADGKPRNPLAFTPFYGGKRICLGKGFAEMTVRFTIPLLYYHFDFEFADPKMMHEKQQYSVGNQIEPVYLMKIIEKQG